MCMKDALTSIHTSSPDYQKLNVLRQLYPKVPILALSATFPPALLKDVLDTPRMPGLTRSASGKFAHFIPMTQSDLFDSGGAEEDGVVQHAAVQEEPALRCPS